MMRNNLFMLAQLRLNAMRCWGCDVFSRPQNCSPRSPHPRGPLQPRCYLRAVRGLGFPTSHHLKAWQLVAGRRRVFTPCAGHWSKTPEGSACCIFPRGSHSAGQLQKPAPDPTAGWSQRQALRTGNSGSRVPAQSPLAIQANRTAGRARLAPACFNTHVRCPKRQELCRRHAGMEAPESGSSPFPTTVTPFSQVAGHGTRGLVWGWHLVAPSSRGGGLPM